MPGFANPFPGQVPLVKMTRGELVRALRLDLAAEEEAIHLYTAHADATDEEIAENVLRDIADGERVHAGEILRLIEALTGDETQFLVKGSEEVRKKWGDLLVKIERSV